MKSVKDIGFRSRGKGESVMVKQIEYQDLPLAFWDTVVYYEYFISFSGFNEIEPHINIWTSTGEQYYLNVKELRDGRFERVIPFFKTMANQEKIANGDLHYFDWKLVPAGWKYYYYQSKHCFIPDRVYEKFIEEMEKPENVKKTEKSANESLEDMITRFSLWKVLLKQAYCKIIGVNINENERTYIRLNEKIHVYRELYVCKILYINQITPEQKSKLKEAIAWEIEYTTPMGGLWNLIQIWIYFDETEPFIMSYEFQRKDLSNYMDEDEFMKNFKELMKCELGNDETGYSFENAPDGYCVFQKTKYHNVYWIREDIFRAHYDSVIVPFINYSGNLRYLGSPICGCVENKKGYIS